MSRWRLWPRSLPGQIVMLAAIALFVAQAINAQLLLSERRAVRLAQTAAPTVGRVIEAVERLRTASEPNVEHQLHRSIRFVAAPEIPPGLPPQRDFEQALRRGLDDNNVHVGRILTGVRPITHEALFLRRMSERRADYFRQYGSELMVAIELPGRGWLQMSIGWVRAEQMLVWQILGQTLVLYLFVLAALLWAGYRIARPLKELAQAARRFTPGTAAEPVAERGPSDVRAVIAAYNSLGTRVHAMLEEKDHMLGAIGHDLRTPLAALRVRVESVEDDDDRARMVDTIDEMNRTLDDILSLARLGRPSEPPTDVDVAALIDAVVDDFRDLGADVSTEEAPRLTMRLRPALMRRALRNLIENAVKYAGSAEVRLVPGERQVEIRVCDRGPGIPEDKLAAVFEAFTRLEHSRNRETGGIGLGLALARAIVREAGGDIVLANREGGGLSARITLPR